MRDILCFYKILFCHLFFTYSLFIKIYIFFSFLKMYCTPSFMLDTATGELLYCTGESIDAGKVKGKQLDFRVTTIYYIKE